MIEDYLTQSAYRVIKSNWTLYHGLSNPTLTLTGTLPTVAFRCAITIYAATGHTDCVGSVIVGSETLFFTIATRKTTTVSLSALPIVTTTDLDCMILIEAIGVGGGALIQEAQTLIDCRFEPLEQIVQYPVGKFVNETGIAYTNDTGCIVGAIFSINGYDHEIYRTKPMIGLDGEEGRKLFLTNKTVAPTGRITTVPGTIDEMNRGTSIGTGADQQILHGISGDYRLELIPLEADIIFSGKSLEADHFHITVTAGKAWAWIATLEA